MGDVSALKQHSLNNARDGKLLHNPDGTTSSVRSGSVNDGRLNNGQTTLIPFI